MIPSNLYFIWISSIRSFYIFWNRRFTGRTATIFTMTSVRTWITTTPWIVTSLYSIVVFFTSPSWHITIFFIGTSCCFGATITTRSRARSTTEYFIRLCFINFIPCDSYRARISSIRSFYIFWSRKLARRTAITFTISYIRIGIVTIWRC